MKRIDTTNWDPVYPPATHMGERLKRIAEGVNDLMDFLEKKLCNDNIKGKLNGTD